MTTCLLCKSTNVEVHLCEMRKCRDCGFFFLSPEERARQQERFHQASTQPLDEAKLAAAKKKYPKSGMEKDDLYAQWADRALRWYGESLYALDVGSSGGFFLHALQERGVPTEHLRTLEVEPHYQAMAREYFGIEGDLGTIETYESTQHFDLVTLLDCLEHVNDFWAALARMRTLLKPGGRLVLKLPNGRWAYLKYRIDRALGRTDAIPKHLYLWDGGHLNYWSFYTLPLLEESGLTLESFEYVRPYGKQFGWQQPLRLAAYRLNNLTHAHLFPEMIGVFQKAPKE